MLTLTYRLVISVLADVRSVILFGQYKRIRDLYEGVLTGKGLTYGGTLIRTEATGYGVVYMLNELMKEHSDFLDGKLSSLQDPVTLLFMLYRKLLSLVQKLLLCVTPTDIFMIRTVSSLTL